MSEAKFWLVCGLDKMPLCSRFGTLAEARTYCERMAMTKPGIRFYVMEMVEYCSTDAVTWHKPEATAAATEPRLTDEEKRILSLQPIVDSKGRRLQDRAPADELFHALYGSQS